MGRNKDLLLSSYIKLSNSTEIGSIYSQLYPFIMRADNSGNTLWTWALLSNHTNLVYQNMLLENGNVYVSSLSPDATLWYSIINYNTGNFSQNQCYQLINDLGFSMSRTAIKLNWLRLNKTVFRNAGFNSLGSFYLSEGRLKTC